MPNFISLIVCNIEPILHLGPDVEIVHSLGPHERQLHVCVCIYPARDHQLVCGVNHPHSGWDLEVRPNFHYFPIFDVNVADDGAVLVYNFPPFDQDPDGFCHSCCRRLDDAAAAAAQCLQWAAGREFVQTELCSVPFVCVRWKFTCQLHTLQETCSCSEVLAKGGVLKIGTAVLPNATKVIYFL